MGDMGDYWRDAKEYRRQRKREVQAKMPAVIKIAEEAGLQLNCLDGEQHYRVNGIFDWWPSTGRWKSLDGKQTGFNVQPLIKAVRKVKP